MDYPVSGKAPDVAQAVVPHTISGGVAVPVGVSNPATVVTQPAEPVSYVSVTSGQIFSSGQSIGGQIAIAGGFVVGANEASQRHLSVAIEGSQTANLSALILRGAASTASTIANGSAVSIAVGDAKQVMQPPLVMAPSVLPGNLATVYGLTGIDLVVPNGGQVVLFPSANVTMPRASSSGVTVGVGIA
jgi:hypothetical protein